MDKKKTLVVDDEKEIVDAIRQEEDKKLTETLLG